MPIPSFKPVLFFGLSLMLAQPAVQAAPDPSADPLWRLTAPETADPSAQRPLEPWIQTRHAQAAELNPAALDALLQNAPLESPHPRREEPLRLSLPTPDGGFETFEVTESPIMAPELAAWFADRGYPLRTFKGRSVQHPERTLRLDWGGPAGLHAMVSAADGESYFLDPARQRQISRYLSYRKRDFQAPDKHLACAAEPAPGRIASRIASRPADAGEVLRSYRTAVAATAEYTAYQDRNSDADAVTDTLAAIATTINRVNEIYERDLSLRLTLIADNHRLIYTDPAADPYTNSSAGAMLSENQANLDLVIGTENYDLGHVFGLESGGIAVVGASCDPYDKAKGVTGSRAPKGDPFDIDYVAHELGHQVGGEHTFNAIDSGACTWGSRYGPTAYEPGSGSTILAYAGICGGNDLQANSDAYFHAASLDLMLQHLVTDGACAAPGHSGNLHAPIVDAGPDYSIPARTPFTLRAAASDDDYDPLTFVWEEFDLGPALDLGAGDNGFSPIIRSRGPSSSPERRIPRLQDLAAGALSAGVTLPTTDRRLVFRVTARDNHLGGGRLGADSLIIYTEDAAGPFLVTAPNGGETFYAATQPTFTVRWDVAATDLTPIGTTHVSIRLSLDGGLSFPYILLASTPNDGRETLPVPSHLSSAKARIMVAAEGNIFFDVSDHDFGLNALIQCSAPDAVIENAGALSDSIQVEADVELTDLTLELDADFNLIGDMIVALEHTPSALAATLADRPGYVDGGWGCSQGALRVTFDDAAATPIETACTADQPADIQGPHRPQEPLSVFDGASALGAWRLSVTDATDSQLTSAPESRLNRWCLRGAKRITEHTLTAAIEGRGAGTVTADRGDLACPGQCSDSLIAGATLEVSATPGPDSTFTGWSGACTGSKPVCTLALDQALELTAHFGRMGEYCSSAPLTLADNGSISDQISVDAAGLLSDLELYLNIEHSWVGDLRLSLENTTASTQALLLDAPGHPAAATGCDGSDIDATLDDQAAVRAEDACAEPPPALGGRLRPQTPLAVFDDTAFAGTWRLTITDLALEDSGRLVQWCLAGETFTPPPSHRVSVNLEGDGAGTVSADTGALACPDQCSADYPADSALELTAAAAAGATFIGWSGACTHAAATCTLNLTRARQVGAAFIDHASDNACSPQAETLSSGFSSGAHARLSATDLSTTGPVIVTGDATRLELRAPQIRLRDGFQVQAGARLHAAAGAVNCDAF